MLGLSEKQDDKIEKVLNQTKMVEEKVDQVAQDKQEIIGNINDLSSKLISGMLLQMIITSCLTHSDPEELLIELNICKKKFFVYC